MTLLKMLKALEQPNDDLALYEICRRVAGWGICWHSEKRGPHVEVPHPNPTLAAAGIKHLLDGWKKGLFVEKYYPTFSAMVRGEYKRLGLGRKS